MGAERHRAARSGDAQVEGSRQAGNAAADAWPKEEYEKDSHAPSRNGGAGSARRTAPRREMDALFREQMAHDMALLGKGPHAGTSSAPSKEPITRRTASSGPRPTASCSRAMRCRSARSAAAPSNACSTLLCHLTVACRLVNSRRSILGADKPPTRGAPCRMISTTADWDCPTTRLAAGPKRRRNRRRGRRGPRFGRGQRGDRPGKRRDQVPQRGAGPEGASPEGRRPEGARPEGASAKKASAKSSGRARKAAARKGGKKEPREEEDGRPKECRQAQG